MIKEAVGAAAIKYGAIVFGLAIGTAAKYGLTLTEGKSLSLKSVLADLLLLSMLGLLAVVVADWFNLAGNARVLAGALAAVSSDRLIRLVRSKFEMFAEQKVDQLAKAAAAVDVAKVPSGNGLPDSIRAEVVTPEAPLTAALKSAYRQPTKTRPPEDQIEALRRLDKLNG